MPDTRSDSSAGNPALPASLVVQHMDRSRWQQHAGEYRAPLGGHWISVLVANEGLSLRLKLNLNRQSMRLTEFRPNLFLTPDGRSVVFRDGSMDFYGLSFVKDYPN